MGLGGGMVGNVEKLRDLTRDFDGVYNGLNVMVTGGYGFKGVWLSRWLERLGANVVRFGHPPRNNSNHHHYLYGESPTGDEMLDYKALQLAIANSQPAIIFHLAAKSIVSDGFKAPRATFENNFMSALNLLDICRQRECVKGVVLVTTDKVYEDKDWCWGYRENDELGGYDPYSASKVAIEHLVRSYRRNFFQMIAVARAGNVIGGGDSSEHRLVPDIIRAAIAGRAVEIDTPGATRPWQHVLEPLSGYLMLGAKLFDGNPEYAKAWNFGPEGSMTVREVLNLACQEWSRIDYCIRGAERHKDMVNLLKIDSTMAHNELGWYTRWSQSMAVGKTIGWYKDWFQNGVINTDANIDHYSFLMNMKVKG